MVIFGGENGISRADQIWLADTYIVDLDFRRRYWARIDLKSRMSVRKLVLIIDLNCKYLNIHYIWSIHLYNLEYTLNVFRSDIVGYHCLGHFFAKLFEGFWALALNFFTKPDSHSLLSVFKFIREMNR